MAASEIATDFGLKSILVAYDFSDASRKPLHHASSIARHFGAKLHVAYVVSSIGYGIAGPEAQQLAYEGSLKDTRRLEGELLERGELSGVEYEFIVREGDIWDQLKLVIQEYQIDGVVVGTHARRGLGRLLLGSVAEQIFRQADCAVLTVGPGSREESLVQEGGAQPTFVFATDFSDGSLQALPLAAAFAHHFGATLVVLHILPASPIPEGFHWSTTGDLSDMRQQAQVTSQKLFERLIIPRLPASIKPEFRVSFGRPAEQILHTCHTTTVDLLVLGLNPTKHAESGSHLPWVAAHEIVCEANCPVLTFKGTSLVNSGVSL